MNKFKFNNRIIDSQEELTRAKDNLRETIMEEQKKCEHPVIHFQEGFYSDIGGNHKSFVCCTSCGLTYFEKYGEFGPFGIKKELNRPLQPVEMDYYKALTTFSLGEHHNKLD